MNELPAPGDRALWKWVAHLAVVKHADELRKRDNWSDQELADLLLVVGATKKEDRFIEAVFDRRVKSEHFVGFVYNPRGDRRQRGQSEDVAKRVAQRTWANIEDIALDAHIPCNKLS